MNNFKFTIISPDGQIFDQDIESLIAPSLSGLFGVLANHAPMIVAIVPGVIRIKFSGQQKFYFTDSGILEVHQEGNVLALLDSATECQTLEEAKRKVKNTQPINSHG